MLNSRHLKELEESGITQETITKYEIISLTEEEVRAKLNRNDIIGGGWLMQYPDSHFYKIKLDNHLVDCKYLSPAGLEIDLFVTHLAREKMQDSKFPLVFCEGEKKALALEQLGYAVIGLCGVWGFKAKGRILSRLNYLLLKDRPVSILFDADKNKNLHVQKAEYSFALFLRKRAAKVSIINLDAAFGKGVDDQIVKFKRDGNLEDLKKRYLEDAENYEDYIKRVKSVTEGKDDFSPVEIADKIRGEYKIIYCAQNFYAYREGCYRCVEDNEIRQWIIKVTGVAISFNEVDEILKFIKVCGYKDIDNLNATLLLNLQNGLFNLETYQLQPHSSDIYSTIQLGVKYDPSAKCDKWIKALNEIFQDDQEKIQTLQEFFGLCFTRDTRYEKALLCVGEGANGKGVLLNTFEQLIGKENCTSIPLEKFCDAHYTANMFGKLANISTETNAKSEVYDSIFKAIISGDPIQADLKFKNAFKFRPFCKLIFAMNNLPRVDDKTNAYYRRLVIIRFNREFSETEQNKNLKNELLLELNGIFIWCLEGLKRLRERGYFDITEKIQQEINEYRKDNNNVIVFVDEECSLSAEFSTEKGNLYLAYVESCKRDNYRPLSKKKFGSELQKHFKTVQDDRSNTTRFWTGIGLSSSALVTYR
jgi:putative DNA primase/helicase